MGDPAAELAALMTTFRTTIGKTDPNALSQSAIPKFVALADSMFDSLKATKARLDARLASNEAREAILAAKEAKLVAEHNFLVAKAAKSKQCFDQATTYLNGADKEMGKMSADAVHMVAKAGYEFEEQLGNLTASNLARQRGYSASVALDVTNTSPRAGVTARSLGVASGNGSTRKYTGNMPPPSPMRKKEALAKHPSLKDTFGFVK
jgi:hypothetical protein